MIATYAYYVWACYGITAAVLALMAWLAKRSHALELQAAQRRLQMSKEKAA
jgi:heme exporter protein CcmD